MNASRSISIRGIVTIALVCAIILIASVISWAAYPDMQNVAKPNPEPTLPTGADTFSPPVDTSTPAANAPAIAEWIRTAAPDDSLVLTGVRFSTYTGSDAGKDSYFAVYGQTNGTGVTANSKIQKLNDVKAAVTLYSSLPTWSMYLLWPGNSAGVGYPVAVNRTEVWWVGPYKASVGDTVSVFGRNLSHDNGTTSSWVYIKPSGSAGQYATVTAVNPYKVDFTVPSGLSNGSYEIWVHNGHGGHYGWGGPVTLTVQSAETWPGGTIDVTSAGAVPNDANDDSTAIETALTWARNSGVNTIVYFPSGTYYVSRSILVGGGANAVGTRMLGAGKTSTIIKFMAGLGQQESMFTASGNGCEFKDLTLDTNGVASPRPLDLRGRNDIRLTNMKLDAHLNCVLDTHGCTGHIYTGSDFIGGNWWCGLYLGIANYFYIKNCNFYGTNDCNTMVYHWGGTGFCMTGCTMQDYDNTTETGWAKGRYYTLTPQWGTIQNVYVGDNTTYDLSSRPAIHLDCEQIMSEAPTRDYVGTPTSATSTTVTFSDLSSGYVGQEAIITKGPGIGQHRTITAWNSGTKTITVSPAWNVAPDSTSKVAITTTTMRMAVYHNTFDGKSNYDTYDVASAGVEFWEGGQDAVIDHNTFTHLRRGGTHNGSYTDSALNNRFNPFYFSIVSNNTISNCYWGAREIVNWDSATVDNGTVYLGNILRNNSYTNLTNDGIVIANGNYGGAPKHWDYALFEHNTFTNTPRGFDFVQSASSATSIFYKNNVNGGAGIGVTGIQVSSGNLINVRENTWSNFTTTYGGTLPGAALEVPYRTVALSSSGTIQTTDISVWNSGTSSLSWTASDDASWLTLSSTSGTVSNENSSSTVTLTANPAGLAAGTYTGTITITGASQTKKLTVTFTVTWVPTNISGLTLWLEADAGVTKDGSNYVATWADQSGNGRNATQSTQANKPLWVDAVQDGRPVMRFDGSTDYFSITGASLSSQSIFIVYKAVNTPQGGAVLYGDGWYIQRGGSNMYQWMNLYTSGFYFETSAFRYMSNIRDGGTGTVYENGTQRLSGSDSGIGILRYIGQNWNGTKFAGDVAEVLIYDSALSTANRQAVETYLKNKYGL